MESQGWMIYQPLIVGLGAVIIAAIGNTAVEWLRHWLAERKETVILRRTLLLELRLVRSYLEKALGFLRQDGGQAEFGFPAEFRNLERLSARAGQLPWDEGLEVSKAAGALFLFMEPLASIMVTTSKRYQSLRVAEPEKSVLAQLAKAAFDRADDAVAALEKGRI